VLMSLDLVRRSSCSSGVCVVFFFFFSSRRRHTRLVSDWSSDVCSSDLVVQSLDELGGEALVCEAQLVEGLDDRQLMEMFVTARRSEERRVGKECRSRWWRGH